MIHPPRHFDLNEWTVIGVTLPMTFLALCLRKRLPLSLSVIIVLFSITTARLCDHILAYPHLTDLYDIMDLNKLDWFDLMTYIMFAPGGYIFVYLYDRWKLRGLQVPLYILVWSLLATGIEWGLVRASVFVYKEWSIVYSFAVYMLVQPLTLWFFRFLIVDEPSYDEVKR
ncbi:MAG: hypothetical protein WCC10_18005 [Tumebacillaceae bacterium]